MMEVKALFKKFSHVKCSKLSLVTFFCYKSWVKISHVCQFNVLWQTFHFGTVGGSIDIYWRFNGVLHTQKKSGLFLFPPSVFRFTRGANKLTG